MTVNGAKHPKDIEQNFPVWMGVAALLMLVFLFSLFKRMSQMELAKYAEHDVVEESVPRDDFQNWLNQP